MNKGLVRQDGLVPRDQAGATVVRGRGMRAHVADNGKSCNSMPCRDMRKALPWKPFTCALTALIFQPQQHTEFEEFVVCGFFLDSSLGVIRILFIGMLKLPVCLPVDVY